jgi:hypothetical protein
MSTVFTAEDKSDWCYKEFIHLGIKCGKIIDRFIRTMSTLSKKPSESIAAASSDKAEAKAIYRLLANEMLTEEIVLDAHRNATIERIKASGKTIILNIQDTTELNYTSHKKTIGLGEYGTESNSRGLITHTAIAVTPEGIALGVLDQKTWSRDPAERGKSNNKQRAIEEKESYKWLESMDNSNQGIPEGITVVNVCDREADIYEFFDKAIEDNRHFLVRLIQNRKTVAGIKSFDAISQIEPSGQVVVEIPRDTRNNRPERTAILELSYCQVQALIPRYAHKKPDGAGYVALHIILAKEVNAPEGTAPIEWYLATNTAVTSFDEAMERVRWYVQRWKIERFHYILKSGCAIEKLQERDASRLQKLILMYSIIAIRILSMTYVARQMPEESCELFFEENEWKVLYCMAKNTSQAPQHAPTIKEAIAYLAKIGGFLGRKSDGEPGVKVIWKGLTELNIVLKYQRLLMSNYGNGVGQA